MGKHEHSRKWVWTALGFGFLGLLIGVALMPSIVSKRVHKDLVREVLPVMKKAQEDITVEILSKYDFVFEDKGRE